MISASLRSQTKVLLVEPMSDQLIHAQQPAQWG